jgi:hypothetical protein
MNRGEAAFWDTAEQREKDRRFAETGEQQYMGQGGLGEAYSRMFEMDRRARQAEIDKMLNVVGGKHGVDAIVEALYDAGYRKK